MNIVIAGAGEVGSHLAYKLSHEPSIDIILIDPDAKKLQKFSEIEILTITGDPLDKDILFSCNLEDVDLFIGVLPDEMKNIFACSMANSLGAKQTIARVSDPRYLDYEYIHFLNNIGIKSIVCPEDLTADEINLSLEIPWARVHLELFNGRFILLGVKVREGAQIVNSKIEDLQDKENQIFHIVAIKRDGKTIYPQGKTIILHNDIVFFTTTPQMADQIRQLTGKNENSVKEVVIMGAGKIALRTLHKASPNIKFTLIEKDKAALEKVENLLPSNASILHGDGRDPEVLREAGLGNAQVFIALTDNSETNVLACLDAKRYLVSKTIAMEENIDYIPLAEKLDIGTILNKKLSTSGYIYRSLLGENTSSVKFLSIANADLAELLVSRTAPIAHKSLREFKLPKGIILGGLIRDGKTQMVNGDTIFQPSDLVIVFCHQIPLNQVKKVFEA